MKFSHDDKIYTAKKTLGTNGKEIFRILTPIESDQVDSSNKSSSQTATSKETCDSTNSCLSNRETTSSFDINKPSTLKGVDNACGEISNSDASEDSDSEYSSEVQSNATSSYESSLDDAVVVIEIPHASPVPSQRIPFDVDHRHFKKIQAISEVELKCPICLIIFINKVLLKCGHSFCDFCIQQWRRTSMDCPECRNRVTLQPIKQVLNLKIHNHYKNKHQIKCIMINNLCEFQITGSYFS